MTSKQKILCITIVQVEQNVNQLGDELPGSSLSSFSVVVLGEKRRLHSSECVHLGVREGRKDEKSERSGNTSISRSAPFRGHTNPKDLIFATLYRLSSLPFYVLVCRVLPKYCYIFLHFSLRPPSSYNCRRRQRHLLSATKRLFPLRLQPVTMHTIPP